MLRQSIVPAICISFLFFSCRHQPDLVTDPGNGGGGGGGTGGGAGTCDPTKVYFQQQVLPILASNCAMSGCHDVTSHEEGIILSSYEYVMASGIVQAGNPFSSDLYEVLLETDPDKVMPPPPRSPLTTAQIALIRDWIQQGAKNLTCQSMCDSTQFTYSGAIRNIITNKCQGCHTGASAGGGIDLSTYLNVKARVTDGKLWGSVSYSAGYSPMPKGTPKLSDCELTQIRKWIDAGALNN